MAPLCNWSLNANRNGTKPMFSYYLFYSSPSKCNRLCVHASELRHSVSCIRLDMIDSSRCGGWWYVATHEFMHCIHHWKYHSYTCYSDPHIHRSAVYLRRLFTAAHLSRSVKDQLSIGAHKSTAVGEPRFIHVNFHKKSLHGVKSANNSRFKKSPLAFRIINSSN